MDVEKIKAELVQVEAAISAVYGSQEYEIQDGNTKRRLKRADLGMLLKRKETLEITLDRLGIGGGGPSYAMPVDSPRGGLY